MFSTLAQAGRYLGQSMRLMVGLPEYDTYVLPRAPGGALRQRQEWRLLLSSLWHR
jgi:hypothetical protein